MIQTCNKHNYSYELKLGGIGCPYCAAEKQQKESRKIIDRLEESLKMLRCKMRVQRVAQIKNAEGKIESEEIYLTAVYGNTEENKQWSKWTPSANFSITISNPDAMNQLSSGHEYFVDFIPASEV